MHQRSSEKDAVQAGEPLHQGYARKARYIFVHAFRDCDVYVSRPTKPVCLFWYSSTLPFLVSSRRRVKDIRSEILIAFVERRVLQQQHFIDWVTGEPAPGVSEAILRYCWVVWRIWGRDASVFSVTTDHWVQGGSFSPALSVYFWILQRLLFRMTSIDSQFQNCVVDITCLHSFRANGLCSWMRSEFS